jgi:PiT family inorganic phosphate transporter
MHSDTGLAGGLVTAGLVLTASVFTLPVSTTHVVTGAIVGAGVRQGRHTVRWRTVGSLLAAWCVTLPVCALGAAAACTWLERWYS